MPLQNMQPVQPGMNWATTVSSQCQEIITTFNAEELDCLTQTPENAIAWANQGTNVSVGLGIVKIPWRLPSSMAFRPFDGTRVYQNLDVASPSVKVSPWDLNFAWPMVWDSMGNATLMSQGADGQLAEFLGVGGLASEVMGAARAYKAMLVASMFYRGYTSAGLSMTATIKTVAQPGMPNGNDFFTDGSGAALHYAHPFQASSGRFQNAYPAFGSFAGNFGRSLVKMTQKPHPLLPNMTMGLEVTDVIGPTFMRDRFWQMAVQSLQMQTTTLGGNGVAAATTGSFALDTMGKWNATSFLGASGFAPVRYWIAPHLDNHPYYKNPTTGADTANMTNGPGGGPADLWINVCALPGKGSWCHLAGPSKEFTPFARLYGPGDPRAQSERKIRLETDLDAGVGAGVYHNVDLFFGV